MSEQQPQLTHLDEQGQANMVNVGTKPDTERVAVAEGFVQMSPDAFAQVQAGNLKKGDVQSVARLAGIMGAKQTANLIPLCHPIPLTSVKVSLELQEHLARVRVLATTTTVGKTGVEMEALTAVSVAALTIYDMAKAIDRTMRIEGIRLLEKQGGKSGHFRAEDSKES
jgi:cyclic pyranopterin monophosphate synthase